MVPLLEEEDVGRNLGPGVGFEGIVGEADGPKELSSSRDVLPNRGVGFIQGPLGGYERHDAARPHLVEGLGEEIVMDCKAMPVILGIRDPVGPERNVPDGRVEEVVRKAGPFVAIDGDVRLLIELAGDTARDIVQLDAVELCSRHALRDEAEEVSRAAGRLQDVSGGQAHPLQGAIDRLHNGGRGVVRVECGGAG